VTNVAWARWLPHVTRLSREEWRSRHRTVTTVVAVHVPLLWLYALHTGRGLGAATLEVSAIVVALAVATGGGRRRTRSLASCLGLLVSSAVVVHLAHGLAEAHFHYFVAVALIALYEEWLVYAVAVLFVVLQHGIMGSLDPFDVFGHSDDSPWLWTAVHTGFVLALCAAQLAFWRASERSHVRELTAEKARQGTARRAQQVIDDAPVGIARVSLTGRYVEVNAAMCALLGRDAAEIVGHDYAEFTHQDDLWGAGGPVPPALAAERRTIQREKRYVRPDGTEVWALVTLSVLDDDAGSPGWYLAQAQDVTERRRRRDARLSLALEVAGTGSWEWDLVAGTVYRSATAARLLGLEADPSGPALAQLHPDDRTAVADAHDRAINDGRFDLEFRVPQPDGGLRWVLSRAELVRDAEGRPNRLVGVSLDVTDRHHAEEERAALRAAEQQAAERAIRLQRLTAALAEALTVEEVRAALVQTSADMPGRPASAFSVFDSERARWVPPSPTEAELTPAVRDALRHRTPVWTPAGPGRGASMALPLVSRGVLHGGWELRWPGEHVRTEDKERFLTTAADLAATTLERARLFEAQREVAELLQRSLLPDRLAQPPGVLTAARYLPAGRAAQVGGDWYDVIPLADGRIGVAIGDVSGHGVRAAALMGQLRGTLRAYALEGRPPGQVLAALNRATSASALPPEQLATVAYAVVDLTTGQVRHARAGHPPLVLVEPAGTGWDPHLLDGPAGLPLGVDEHATYPEATADLYAGSWLLGYTDGFVERRNEPFDAGLDRLLDALRGSSRSIPDEILDELLATVPGPADDDIALIALRSELDPAPRLLHLPKPRRVLPD
jgi:PAS domain S-box-containing protein